MMKKILYGLTLMAAMVSCTEDYKDWASPTVNPQEAAQNVTLSVSNAAAINYDGLTADSVQLFNPTVTSTVADVKTSFKAILWNANHDDFAEMNSIDSKGYVSADDLKAAVEQLYGKRPEAHNIPINIAAYTNVYGQSIANAGEATITVTLKAPFIDSGYWLTGDFAGWNKEGALAFTHLGGGDVYDNPEFQIVFTTTADNQYWKIIPQGNYDSDFWAGGEKGVVGTVVDGDTSMEGNLVTDNPQAGKIEQAGIYRMTINMMNYTYKIEKMNYGQFVYFIGATDGWATPDQRLESPNFDGNYEGYVYVADPNGWGLEFKFQRVAGDWGDDSQLNSNNMNAVTGDFEKGGDNFKASAGEGVYYVTINLGAMTMNAVKINNMNLVGDFNGWNPGDDAQQMKWNATDFCWEITGAGVTANGWKFTANNGWDINLGETPDNLKANGANLSIVGSTIKLYPTRKTSDNIYCTVE